MPHPFDEIAFLAGASAMKYETGRTSPGEIDLIALSVVALTASWASLVERGLAPGATITQEPKL